MVDIQVKIRRRLTERDHMAIRYLRYCGWSQTRIGERFSVSKDSVARCVAKYGLNAPVGDLEGVKLELQAAFRETNRRLESGDLAHADHARLCALQVRQAATLLRLLKSGVEEEDKVMGRKSDTARERILSLTDEEAMDEIRRLAGLEPKFTQLEKHDAAPEGKSYIAESLSDPSDESTEAA